MIKDKQIEAMLEAMRLKYSDVIYDQDNELAHQFEADLFVINKALAEQPAQQEPVAKPYAYEYGRNNGDGTYSVVIEKGDLVQTAPGVYNYVRPRNAHKDWPIKELFDRPQAQPRGEATLAREPLTLPPGRCASEWGGRATGPCLYTDDEVFEILTAHGITKGNT